MSKDLEIGKYKIETENVYTTCFERRSTSNKDLKALDYNKDKTITENELQIFDLGEENTEITEQIKNKNDEIKAINKQIKTQEKELKQKNKELKKKTNKSKSFFTSKKKKETLITEIAQTNKTISSVEQSIKELEEKVEKLNTEIVVCQENIEENNKIKADLIAGKKSASKKATAKAKPTPISKNTTASNNINKKYEFNFKEDLTEQQKSDLKNFKANYTKNQEKYKTVEAETGVPSELVAAIHWRESSGNFNTYLHNGDPLGKPTTHVPKGKNFSDWTEAAIDALNSEDPSEIKKGDLDTYYEFAEKYNGLGYKMRNVKSPYVWSGTNLYSTGKFVADGRYDPDYKDKQLGVAVMVKSLLV